MVSINFTISGSPVAKGRPRFAKRGKFVTTYTPKETKVAESNFRAQALPFAPKVPLQTALKVTLVFSIIKPKSKPKKVKYCTTRPDLDNFLKLILDAMNGIFWRDDAQIVSLHCDKIYSDTNYTSVIVEELP